VNLPCRSFSYYLVALMHRSNGSVLAGWLGISVTLPVGSVPLAICSEEKKMKQIIITLTLVLMSALFIMACSTAIPPIAPQAPVIQTVVVVQAQTLEGDPVEVTRIVEGPAAPVEPAAISFTSKNPVTYYVETFGDPEGFDPALAYESGGVGIIEQTYETLVTYNRNKADELVPQLAEALPEINVDGTTYTFTIREGITFHEGGDLTAEDVAYSFQRGLLQGGFSSPQLLLTEPILGVGIYDITELLFADDPEIGDKAGDPTAVQAADPALLQATCEAVTTAIAADGNTVTFTLAQPWAPFLSTLAGGWGSIMDKEWAIENGAWDGDCATWQNYYGISSENDPFSTIINGTGPYKLERWTPGEELVLVANENYWRTEEIGPAFEGGPVGVPALTTIVIKTVLEFGTRFAALQAGDADSIAINADAYPQLDEMVGERCDYNFDRREFDCTATDNANGALRGYYGMPTTSRTDMMFTWAINVDGGNPFVGSGALDGNGITPNFFTDINVRRGFAYCMDWNLLINNGYAGDAIQNVGPIIPGMLGYNPDSPAYTFDADRCKKELATAWGGALPESGFRVQFAYNTGGTSRQIVGEILQANLDAVSADNPTPGNYVVEVIGLPWPDFLRNQREGRLPLFVSGWHQDIHDPHNWVQPFFLGTNAIRMGLPDEVITQFRELIDAGVTSTDNAERQAIYEQITQLDYEYVIGVRLVLASSRRYEQRWVKGYYYNPALSSTSYYSLSKE
jgi:peptide/nickel transport system substrate-binding protein